jgi:hypothetical protein
VLVAGGADKVRLWDAETRSLLASLDPPNPTRGVAMLSGPERRVLSMDGDTLRLWRWRVADLVEEACARWPRHAPVEIPAGLGSSPRWPELCGAGDGGS